MKALNALQTFNGQEQAGSSIPFVDFERASLTGEALLMRLSRMTARAIHSSRNP
jgi:hypothetical protein